MKFDNSYHYFLGDFLKVWFTLKDTWHSKLYEIKSKWMQFWQYAVPGGTIDSTTWQMVHASNCTITHAEETATKFLSNCLKTSKKSNS